MKLLLITGLLAEKTVKNYTKESCVETDIIAPKVPVAALLTIKQINKQGQFTNIKFQAATEILEQIIVKGSVAIDGISLTVAGMDENSFEVALIPETLKKTTLGPAKIGDTTNIETDIIVKTVRRQLENILPKKQGLTLEKLNQLGF